MACAKTVLLGVKQEFIALSTHSFY